jgi:bifunctional non-homologous end joining protein LigD
MPDTSIRTYKAKRNFKVTAEPPPDGAVSGTETMFVVQKHAAHRAGLHWDFRLEHGGVLWSWAVPKGPSLDPADRRIAIHVEDHPVDYAEFQGVIPPGEYGGGSVETWDRGTWQAIDDPEDGLRKGNLRFVLHGARLSGRFTLARLNRRDARKQEAWFLIKGHDEFAREGVGAVQLEKEVKAPGKGGSARRIGRKQAGSETPIGAAPPSPALRSAPSAGGAKRATIVFANAPAKSQTQIGGVKLTHPDRELWPGITKQDLATYWQAVAPQALPGLAKRPLSIVRCPDGVGREQFFQKTGHGYMPKQIREGRGGGQPYFAIDDVDGLVALTQLSAIEIHPWGASEADPLRPDRMVFDLDPGENVPFARVVTAALEVRERLGKLGLLSFCRTTGGKGLHVVVPLRPVAGWDVVKPFCRAFAETMAQDQPLCFLAHLKIADRSGRILVDWLRNGLGATAVSSFCPRARPGATVATPVAWAEVKPDLNPAAFTVLTVPDRLAKLKRDPWAGFEDVDQHLPDFGPRKSAITLPAAAVPTPKAAKGSSHVPGTRIVVARKPRPKL